MRQASSVLVLALTMMAAMAGCAAHQYLLPGHCGTVTGTLIFGGPVGRIGPVPGQVVAANSASGQFTVTAGEDGRFSLYLPAGSYQLTGHSPKVTLNGAEVECSATLTPRMTSMSPGSASTTAA